MTSDDFTPLEIRHRELVQSFLAQDPPRISELTFTNLFIWRKRYRPVWRRTGDCLLFILNPAGRDPFGLEPVGPGDKGKALDVLCAELGDLAAEPEICRVSEAFVDAYVDPDRYEAAPDRDNSDYVYRTEDLIHLAGRKYHRKKNFLNRFRREYDFRFLTLVPDVLDEVLDMQEKWCQMKACIEQPDLLSEDYAVREALTHFEELGIRGGAIEIDSHLEAFCIGEPLDKETAVIHIEKGNPDIPGIYAAINQQFCEHAWSHMAYINREQDLGVEGLRKAKTSYYPHDMVNKYTLRPR
jgi:hypothetical protein